MPNTLLINQIVETPLFRKIPRYLGIAVALFGILIVASWYARWQSILQMLPDTAPMQFNTALCFILLGAALSVLTSKHSEYATLLGGAAAFLALLTLAEYLTGLNLFVDQIFFKPYFEVDTMYPGRMSPLAAVCFILSGAGVLAVNLNPQWPQRLIVAGLSACVVAVIALVALAGFVFGIQSAYGWGSYSRMALNTAVVFLVLAGGLLLLSWQTAQRERFNFLRWLPVTGSVTLMVMVAFVSAVNLAELKNATFWRKHTIQVILGAHELQDNLTALQLGMRGYVTLHDTNALASYQACLQQEPPQFDELAQLTRDNHAQQQPLRAISAAMDDVVSYDQRMIAVYEQEGFAGVSKSDATGEGRRVFGAAINAINNFSQSEEKLLSVRGAVEQADADNAAHLLIFGSALAALLLVLANKMASRELRNRQRAETKLNQALQLQKAILDSADYGIVSTDPKGIVLSFNHAAEQMLGYSANEVVGKVTPMIWRDPKEIAERAINLSKKLDMPVKPTFEAIAMKVQFDERQIDEGEWTFIRKDGSRFTCFLVVTILSNETGNFTGFMGIFRDISKSKQYEAERERLIAETQAALAEVKTLSGMIPICGWCKNVRSDQGYWQSVEQYVRSHTAATFSHGICPTCTERMKADILKRGGGEPQQN